MLEAFKPPRGLIAVLLAQIFQISELHGHCPLLLQISQEEAGKRPLEAAAQTSEAGKSPEKTPKVPLQQPQGDAQAQDSQEGPPSPLSEASSGYFSHSVSTATLSEALAAGSDAVVQPGGQIPTSSDFPAPAAAQASSSDGPGHSDSSTESRLSNKREIQLASGLQTTHTRPKDSPEVNGNGALKPKSCASPVSPSEQASDASGGSNAKNTFPTSSPKKELSKQSVESAGQAPRKKETASGASDLGFPKSHIHPDQPSQPAVAASPFKIQKVKTSELKSFTSMLGTDPPCAPNPEEQQGEKSASTARGLNQNGSETAEEKLEMISDSEDANEVPEWLKEGEYVTVGANKTGIIRYVGPTDFQEGTWVGVELDLPSGKISSRLGAK